MTGLGLLRALAQAMPMEAYSKNVVFATGQGHYVAVDVQVVRGEDAKGLGVPEGTPVVYLLEAGK